MLGRPDRRRPLDGAVEGSDGARAGSAVGERRPLLAAIESLFLLRRSNGAVPLAGVRELGSAGDVPRERGGAVRMRRPSALIATPRAARL
jgi:hypothetical protein